MHEAMECRRFANLEVLEGGNERLVYITYKLAFEALDLGMSCASLPTREGCVNLLAPT